MTLAVHSLRAFQDEPCSFAYALAGSSAPHFSPGRLYSASSNAAGIGRTRQSFTASGSGWQRCQRTGLLTISISRCPRRNVSDRPPASPLWPSATSPATSVYPVPHPPVPRSASVHSNKPAACRCTPQGSQAAASPALWCWQ